MYTYFFIHKPVEDTLKVCIKLFSNFANHLHIKVKLIWLFVEYRSHTSKIKWDLRWTLVVPHKNFFQNLRLTFNINKKYSPWNLESKPLYSSPWGCIALNFCSKTSWSIVLKAFWRSIKVIPVNEPSSNPFEILPVKKGKQRFFEWFAVNLVDSGIIYFHLKEKHLSGHELWSFQWY